MNIIEYFFNLKQLMNRLYSLNPTIVSEKTVTRRYLYFVLLVATAQRTKQVGGSMAGIRNYPLGWFTCHNRQVPLVPRMEAPNPSLLKVPSGISPLCPARVSDHLETKQQIHHKLSQLANSGATDDLF